MTHASILKSYYFNCGIHQMYPWFNSYELELVPIFYHRDKTRVHMFYFDSNTCVPLKCPELALWKADVDRMMFDRLFLWPPLVKNTHLVFLTFYVHFLSQTRGFLSKIHGYRCVSSILSRLQCVVLAVWKDYVDRISFGWRFLGIPIKFLPCTY